LPWRPTIKSRRQRVPQQSFVGDRVGCARPRGLAKDLAQPRGVFALKIERLAEYPRLVTTARVGRVQAIVFELCDVDERLSPCGSRSVMALRDHRGLGQQKIDRESAMGDTTGLNIFVPITKIDTAKRLVYGVVTAETPDAMGEVCDYASTKPLYQQWSRKFADATDGRSFGNLRAMHSSIAAGKLIDIAFNDAAKRIEICGKVVDDAEWQKVEEGVYTGFSQGGRYLKRWPDPDEPKLVRYTAEPLEVSLVDHPCLPEATFAVIKADGSTELRKFRTGDPRAPLADGSLRAQRSNPGAANPGLADPGLANPVLGAPDAGLLRRPVGAPRNDGSELFAKIGARHSKADKERIKQSHDLLVALDPDCCPGAHLPGANVEPRPKFSPQAGEHGDGMLDGDESEKFAKGIETAVQRSLAKALGAVTTRMDEIAARLKKIEDQPLPLGTSSVRVAEKSEDSLLPTAEHLLDRPGALEALADAAIRRAQAVPMRDIPGFRPRQG
jgi:hypothetical protein